MAKQKRSSRHPRTRSASGPASGGNRTSSSVDELLLAALERGDDSMQTGRYLATFREGATPAALESLGSSSGFRIADARDFDAQSVMLEGVAGADAVVFPEIGVALLDGDAARERGLDSMLEMASDSSIASIDPEYFVFAEGMGSDYLRGFMRAAETIARDLADGTISPDAAAHEEALVAGATWGVIACRANLSTRSGSGITVAVLDTGMDLGHPDFKGRTITSATFVGQPVQDIHGHGTHCIGTACGPQAPTGTTPRYGVAHRASISAGKVLSNSGASVGGSVLAGMNWAIANRHTVISLSLGGPGGPQPYYTAAGQAALDHGLLMIAAAGNEGAQTGSPADSPTIMAVAALAENLIPPSFSNFGKIDIAAPGSNVFSSVPRPKRHGVKSGTSMACPHVAGCAALWAETSSSLRGIQLWNKLRSTARALPFPASRVGAGLVQAP